MSKKFIKQYRNKCTGCAACTQVCPEYWEISPIDGKSILKGSELKGDVYQRKLYPEDIEKNNLAAKSCPVKIIRIE